MEETGTVGLVKERIEFIRTLKGKTDWIIWLGVNGLSESQEAQDLALLTVLRRKAYVFDTGMDYNGAMQSKLSTDDKKLFKELKRLKGLLSSAFFASSNQSEKYVSQLKEKINNIQCKLVHQNSNKQRSLKDITIQKVQN